MACCTSCYSRLLVTRRVLCSPHVVSCVWSLAFAIQYVYHLSDVACSINDPNGKQIFSPRMLQRIEVDVAF